MKRFRLVVGLRNNDVMYGRFNSDPIDDVQMGEFKELIREFKRMNHFKIVDSNGDDVFFHPDAIAYVKIETSNA